MIGLLLWIVLMIYVLSKELNEEHKRVASKEYFKSNVIKYGGTNIIKGYKDVTKDKLEKFNITDINTLKDFVYDTFYQFELAYNNLDYNVMKSISTKELYNNYYTGISLDLKTGKKRIINDIERKKVIIYGLDSTSIKQTILAYIEVEYYNYIIDKNGDVISGNRQHKTKEKFEVIMRKDFEREDIYKCPNCGATLTGNKCSYCRTTLKNVEFKISSIKRLVKIDEE